MRPVRTPALCLAALALAACGAGEKPSALPAGAVTPLPIVETLCPVARCPDGRTDELAGTLTLSEVGGVGFTLSGIQLDLRRAVTGSTAISQVMDTAAITAAAGTLKVAANGQLAVPFSFRYDQVYGSRAGALAVSFAGLDDNGLLVGGSTGADLVPRGALPSARLSFAITPATLQEGPCPASHCGAATGQLEAAGTLTVTESNGFGVTVTAVSLVLRANAGGAAIASGSLDDAAIAALAGTNKVAAKGQLAIPIGVRYDQASGGRAATLTASVNAVDENGHQLTGSATAAVTP